MINIVVPLLGKGQRFQEAGYLSSKPLIMSSGKEMIFWLLDSLLDDDDNVFIVYRNSLDVERFSEKIYSRYGKKVNLLPVSQETEGAAQTLLIALSESGMDLSLPLAVCDADTFYEKNHVRDIKNVGNCIFYFLDTGIDPIYSYLKLENDRIVSIEEKVKVSDFASVGTYCFENGFLAKDYCKKIISKNIRKRGEFYISSVFQEMINDGITVASKKVQSFNCIGTPAQLQSSKSKLPLRVCFDLDSTLVTEPRIKGDYSTVDPIQKNIDFLKNLRSEGHVVIIQTARGMKSHISNVGKLTANLGKVTFDTLEKFEIPYDEIYFGKPFADVYIDDKAVNAYSDLEKSTGIYGHPAISRQHNVVKIDKKVVIKSSKSHSILGEKHWYLNIPKDLRHLFPKLLSYKTKNGVTELSIEKITGPTFSKLITTGAFQQNLLVNLVKSLDCIHESQLPDDYQNVNVYRNYADKLDERFIKFDQSILTKEVKTLYEDMKSFLLDYEDNKCASISNIHGDPVFTNVLLDKNNRIKFIDMRGLQGDFLTIAGDKNYDYAKVIQSLLGYDYIVHGRTIDNEYLKNLRDLFFTLVPCDKIKILKISSTLLFTCIPLQPSNVWLPILEMSRDCFYQTGRYAV